MSSLQVAFLGPEGTYAHIVAKQRYPEDAELIPLPSIPHVFDYVRAGSNRCGIVPIENSSGGTIYVTVDLLIDPDCGLVITEELSLDVKLALLGRRNAEIRTVYSHFAPFKHCGAWLRKHHPTAKLEEVPSTGEAARMASTEEGAAALAARDNAELYGLEVLEYPVEQDTANVTQFVTIGQPVAQSVDVGRTSVVLALSNEPGALASFLAPLSAGGVNLTRIISRPVHGQPSTFFIELEGTTRIPAVADALREASSHAVELRIVGEYPALLRFES